ncbi:MAG: PilZ domain-containing protein [Candidatus Omnitrophota bacterium]|jgi:c-di-GMP-binding flagellar brake protein YcgR|nr:PilZ domain-containing protein [Candidatus Omnitrophota bacterium]|tara:strand:+ start:162 stop:542 length:381 start_codon:yes stop_codon:yes gene_type:complete
MIKERRKYKRSKKQLPLKIADKTFDIITETADISSSGIYCRVTRFLSVMSKIEVVILVPTKPHGKQTKKIRCRGIVVRSEPIILKDTEKAHYNVAIFFSDMSDKDKEAVVAYVNSGNKEAEIEIKN